MLKTIKSHLHPLGGRIIFWNFVLFLLVKLIIPNSAFQSASLLGLIPSFDSRDIVKSTNEARMANNLPALSPNTQLDLAASEKLNDMALQEYFAHTSPSGITPWYWIKDSQYKYSVAGENLAIGFVTAKDTVQAWLNSPSHRANLLNNQYQDIGVAVKSVEINNREGILVVQMFGKPSGQVVVITKIPSPSPLNRPTISTRATPNLVLNSPQTRGESVSAITQEVSTDKSLDAVKEPMSVQFYDAKQVVKVSKILNSVFSIYAMLIASISVIAFFFFERSKNMALKMAFNTAVFILALAIPASQIIFEGWIF